MVEMGSKWGEMGSGGEMRNGVRVDFPPSATGSLVDKIWEKNRL